MKCIHDAFLNILRAALCAAEPADPCLTESQWDQLFRLASEQDVLPLIYDRARFCLSLSDLLEKSRSMRIWSERAVCSAAFQIIRTDEFLMLLDKARDQGMDAAVLKGIVCRDLYPVPALRPSVDEDLLIKPQEMGSWHRFFVEEGLSCDQDSSDSQDSEDALLMEEDELSYHRSDSPIYIELHKCLFDPKSEIFGDLNFLFDNLQTESVEICGVIRTAEEVQMHTIRTLTPTDHLLFLILHAFKHFLYSGVGVRTICDIGMFSEKYGDRIDWEHICSGLESVHALFFAKALYRIIQLYLMPESQFDASVVAGDEIDVEPLLTDILDSGVHGDSSLVRLHSSNMTLSAVEAHRGGIQDKDEPSDRVGTGSSRRPRAGILRSAFPPLKSMRTRYPYLKKAPFLLPVAWVQRIAHYLKETRASGSGSAVSESAQSIRLGRERVELLKKYHII